MNDELELTTLGRGGSDTTAVALAASNQILVKFTLMLMAFMLLIQEF